MSAGRRNAVRRSSTVPSTFDTRSPLNLAHLPTSASHTLLATRSGPITSAGHASVVRLRASSAASVALVLPRPGRANKLQRGMREAKSTIGFCHGRGVQITTDASR